MTVTNAAAARCAASGCARAARVLLVISAALLCAAAVFTSQANARTTRQRGCANAHSPARHTSRRVLQRAVVCLINQQRTERGLPRLDENQRLNRSAQGWTNVMVSHGMFTHGADFSARISAVGFNWSSAGENIASGFRTPAAVVRGWMGSPGHCRNILTPTFLDVGVGVSARGVSGAHGATWTEDFGLPMSSRAPSGNWGPAGGCPY